MFTLWSICSALYLYALVSEAVTTIKPLNLEVLAGENAVFQCNTDQNETASWQWFKNLRIPVATENGYVSEGYSMTVSMGTSELTKYNTTIEDDQTQYHCHYISDSSHAYLTVTSRLDVIYPLCGTNTTSVNSDKTVLISCSAKEGNQKPELQWYRNGVKLTEQVDLFDGKSSYFDEITYILTIDDEETVFMCKAEGPAADENQSCQLQLRVPPHVYIISNATSFTSGGSLFLTCKTMSPWKITDYIWTINNELLIFSELKYILKNDGRNIEIFDHHYNCNIFIRCDVTTSSGLVGNDTIELKYEDKTSNDSNDLPITLILCLSFCMFFLGLCIGILVKFSKVLKSIRSIFMNKTKSDQNRSENHDTSIPEPCYQNTIIENDRTISGEMTYSGLVPTTPSIYAELNKIKVDE